MQNIKLIFSWIFLFVFCFSSRLTAQSLPLPPNFPTEAFWYDGKWAHEKSKLPPRSDVSFHRLKNGLRYAVIPNKNPKGRVTLYLNVQVGSLMERPDQLGYAHFLEHMVFNGSRNYPAGTLIEFFQKNGMSFGGDTNAHTSLAETVYKLNLAKDDKKTVQDGLQVLRDFADGATISQKEVDAEKGVILSEKAVRDGEVFQARKKRFAEIYAGTAFTSDVIGTQECIENATAESIQEFYKTWYHPSRMILVIVGNVQPKFITPLVKKAFDSMPATPAPVVPSWGDTLKKRVYAYSVKRPISGSEVFLFFTHQRSHQNDSHQTQLKNLINITMQYCLQQRLSQRKQQTSDLWSQAGFINMQQSGLMPMVLIYSKCPSGGEYRVLDALAEEINSVKKFGFGKQEIEQAKRYITSLLDKRAKMKDSMLNRNIADEFVYIANQNQVYTSVDFNKKLFAKLSPQITPEKVKETLIRTLDTDKLSLFVETANPPSDKKILQHWQTAISRPAKEHIESKGEKFPYLPLAETYTTKLPELTKKKLDPAQANAPTLHSFKLQNGIPVYLLPTLLEKDEIAKIRIFFGNPQETYSKREIILRNLAEQTLAQGGLGKLSEQDTQRLFIELGGRTTENYDAFGATISGSAFSSQLTNLILAAYTQFKDPIINQKMLDRVKMNLDLQKKERFFTVDGVHKAETAYFLHGNNPCFAPLEASDAESIKLKELQEFLQQLHKQNPTAIFVTGNFNIKEACTQLGRTFGNLPIQKPENAAKNDANQNIFPAGKSLKKEIDDSVDKAKLVFARYYPLNDVHNQKLYLTRQLAASVLQDYFRQELRENMGVTYSPQVYYQAPLSENGYGYLVFNLSTENKYISKIKEFVDNIKAWKITKEELKKARLPLQTSWKTMRNTNAFWQRYMQLEIKSGLPTIKWTNETEKYLKNITEQTVTTELANMLNGEKTFVEIKSKIKNK